MSRRLRARKRLSQIRRLILAGQNPKSVIIDLKLDASECYKYLKKIGFSRVYLLPDELAALKIARRRSSRVR